MCLKLEHKIEFKLFSWEKVWKKSGNLSTLLYNHQINLDGALSGSTEMVTVYNQTMYTEMTPL